MVVAPIATGNRRARRCCVGAIAWALSDSVKVGGWFALLFTIALLVLLILAAVALRVLRFALNRVRLHLPSFFASRPRKSLSSRQSIGSSACFTGHWRYVDSRGLLDAEHLVARHTRDCIPEIAKRLSHRCHAGRSRWSEAFFQHQPGITQPLDLLAGVQGRFVSLNGKTLDEMKEQHFPRRMLENAELSWADAPPAGDKVTQGKWWNNANVAEIAIGEGTAQRLHLSVGSQWRSRSADASAH